MSLDELLLAARAGAPDARNELVKAIGQHLRGFFRARCPTPDVDDLVHDTCVVLLGKLDDFTPAYPGAFGDFVFGVARNKLLASRRAWAREHDRRVSTAPLAKLVDAGLSSLAVQRDLVAKVRREIEALGTRDRNTILAWLRSELDGAAAGREGLSPVTLRTRLHRALARLRLAFRRANPALMPNTTG